MPAQIKYAYLKGQTWLFRRNYPKEVAVVLGSLALKQSLQTGDVKVARSRAAEVNARYETTVTQVLAGAQSVAETAASRNGWGSNGRDALACLRATLELSEVVPFAKPDLVKKVSVSIGIQSGPLIGAEEGPPFADDQLARSGVVFR